MQVIKLDGVAVYLSDLLPSGNSDKVKGSEATVKRATALILLGNSALFVG